MAHVNLLISAATSEFGSYRDALDQALDRPGASFKIQRRFYDPGTTTLVKLDDYVRDATAVLHLVGEQTGAPVAEVELRELRQRHPTLADKWPALADALSGATPCSYTQWEAYLALVHGKRLFTFQAAPDAECDPATPPAPTGTPAEPCQSQADHLARLERLKRFPNPHRFRSAADLGARFAMEGLVELLVEALVAERGRLTPKPVKLRYQSLGSRFKGRGPLLEKLNADWLAWYDRHDFRTTTAPPLCHALHGLGGVGKTRLAVEYARRFTDHYTALLFVDAPSPGALTDNLGNLCELLGVELPEAARTNAALRRLAVVNWLQAHPGWLLILDNVDDDDETHQAAEAAEALLADLHGGHVLLTTRLTEWSGSVKRKRLDVLSADDATAFLLERTAPDDDQPGRRLDPAHDAATARALAHDDLGGLALALEQAGANIVADGLTLAQYRAAWTTNHAEVLKWEHPRVMQYDRSVATTWLTSFRRLTAPGRLLLNRLAWLAPAPIPETLLLDVPVPDVDPIRARPALTELVRYSLATRADQPTFTIHRLVQDVTRQQLLAEEATARLTEALKWVDAAFRGDPQDVSTWRLLDPLLPHALAVTAEAYMDLLADPGLSSRLLNQSGVLLQAKAQLREAEPLMRRALALDEVSFGINHPTVAVDLNNLAGLLQDTNRLAEAEPLMRRGLVIEETNRGQDHPYVATHLNNLAQLLKATNRLAEAEPLMHRALAIDEAGFGPDNPKVAIRLNNLATLLQATNRLAEAEPLIRRALAIDEGSFGSDHPNVAIGLNNLAILLHNTNRLAEAEPLIRRALTIDEASFGPDHPAIARDLNNLATLLQNTNRLAEAEPLMQRVVAIFEHRLGSNHPQVAVALNNLAQLLQSTDHLDEAESLMRRALAIDEASFGIDHPKIAIRLNNLALLLQATNRLPEAESLMRRHLVIFIDFTRRTGHPHPHLRAAINNYAGLLTAMGHTQEQAIAQLQELLRSEAPS